MEADSGTGLPEGGPASSIPPRVGVFTLLFTDVVGSTALKQQLGDRAGVDLLQQHHALVRRTFSQFPGAEEIVVAGDSFLVVFPTPSDGVKCALLLQARLLQFNQVRSVQVEDRIGLHLGEVRIEQVGPGQRNVHGMQVDTCARVMSLARAGQILMTRPVFDNARQSLKGEEIEGVSSLSWLNHGQFELKGVDEPVEICEVRAGEGQALAAPTTSEKTRRVEAAEGEAVLGWRPAVGQMVPNTQWVLEQKLGEGGFGEVWLGQHQAMKERRVFKFCFRADRVRSLKREMTLFRLIKERIGDHPNIVSLRDVYFEEAPYYVEEEYVVGQDLRNWCAAQGGVDKVPLENRLEIVAQVADALQAAHDAGVIHRDVKPANILVSTGSGRSAGCQPAVLPTANRQDASSSQAVADWRSAIQQTTSLRYTAKLTDFGIGQVISEETLVGVTRAGFTQTMLGSTSSQTGTQLYMAPELLAGKPASTRSDIYSLGVVLYQLLVGDFARPVATDWAEGIADPLLRDDLHHCFAGNPQDRFAAAGLLGKNLRSLPQRQAALAAQQAELAARERAAYRRGIMRTAGVAMVIVAVVAALALIALNQSRRARLQANRAEQQTRIAESRAEESRQRLVQVNVGNGVRLMNEGQLFASLPWLVEALRLEEGRLEGEDLQRQRLGAVLAQCPKLTQMWFHDGPVNCAAFSPDGRHVATGTGRIVQFLPDRGTPGQAQVWDVETGERVGRPLVHGGSISRLRFSPDGRGVATASADGSARVWDTNTGEPVTQPLQHSNSVVSVVFSRDGTLVATASLDNTARVWRANNGQPVTAPLPHLAGVWGADFSPDGTHLVTASSDLRFWDTRNGALLFTNRQHSTEVTGGVRWSPDGSRWITASPDFTAKLWDASAGKVLATFKHDEEVNCAAFSPDGQEVVTASVDSTARVWSAQTGASITPPLRHGGWVCYAEFSPDGLVVVTACRDHTARVWDATTGRPLTPPLPHGGEVRQAMFSPDGHRLLTVSYDGTARLWEIAPTGLFVDLTHRLPVTCLALSPDNRRVLTASADGTAQVWDLDTGKPFGPPIQHLRGVSEAAFSPDGRRILTASYDRTAQVWEAGTGKLVTPPMVHKEGVVHAAFSPDGRRVATASTDKTAAVWGAATGERMAPFLIHPREVQWVAFSPDGQRLVTACRDRLARVWETTSGKELLQLKGHKNWVLQATYSPDGKQILTASTDNTAAVWEASSGQRRVTLGHGDPVMAAGFSTNGKRIVTASWDGTARVWDAENGRAITPPLRHDGVVQQAVFSSDGRWVVTASWDQTVRLWSATTGDPITPPFRLAEAARDARLSLDGQRLITASGSAAQLWNLTRETRPAADLVLLTQLLTGQATDARGQVIPLDGDAIKKAWQTLKAKPAEQHGEPSARVRAWHRQTLAQALKQQQGFAVRWHLDRLLELLPGDESLRRLRASVGSYAAGSATGGSVVSARLAEPRSRIPPQETGAAENLIDLSDHYSGSLVDGWEEWLRWNEFNNLSSLARAIQTLAGVSFDVRGRVQLQGTLAKGTGYDWPERITGIRVGRPCRRLHFLHGAAWDEAEGKEIARYVMHFNDGQQSERLIRYGNDVRNFWLKVGDSPEHLDAVRAWVGTNALAAETGVSFRLYKSVWENPRPDVPVGTIDFISTMSDCAPFLIAITAEP